MVSVAGQPPVGEAAATGASPIAAEAATPTAIAKIFIVLLCPYCIARQHMSSRSDPDRTCRTCRRTHRELICLWKGLCSKVITATSGRHLRKGYEFRDNGLCSPHDGCMTPPSAPAPNRPRQAILGQLP